MTKRVFIRLIRQRGLLILAGFILLCSVALAPRAFGETGASYVPDCNDPDARDLSCLHPTPAIIEQAYAEGYPYYIGHAEPTAEFFSRVGTSGYNMQWKFQLPATDPSPTQNGSSVANFELYVTFWMGLALCDPNSNPFGPCTPTSDLNNPNTAGAAFLELQFYPPGINCSNSQWCANLHINTLQNNTAFQRSNCLEPTTAAYITTNGTPGGTKLLMSNGDSILVTIHDTANGLEAIVKDLTSGTTGSMVASGANQFVHNANQTDCTTSPFNFHAMYATASPGQVVPWATLQPNVSFDFEIGHFQLCGNASCSTLPDSDADDTSCTTVRGIGGCFAADTDHDGTSYLADWPDGTAAHPATLVLGSPDDRGVGPLSTSTTMPSNYDEGYNKIKFMTTEATTGAFYPFFSQVGTGAACRFNFGNDIGTPTNDFGKAAQYGTTIDNSCLPGTPPVAKCKDTTVPTDPNRCSAAVASIDNGSFDADGDPVTLSQSPSGPYSLGTTLVTLTVTEPETLSNSCMAKVTVVDQQPPTISSVAATPNVLWPPDHKLVPVTVAAAVHDNCDPHPVCRLIAIASNEAPLAPGSGQTPVDFEITGPLTANLRAERSGTGDGRVYTLTVQCTDQTHNSATATTTVQVPHDRRS